jgi:hypothetical protein
MQFAIILAALLNVYIVGCGNDEIREKQVIVTHIFVHLLSLHLLHTYGL